MYDIITKLSTDENYYDEAREVYGTDNIYELAKLIAADTPKKPIVAEKDIVVIKSCGTGTQPAKEIVDWCIKNDVPVEFFNQPVKIADYVDTLDHAFDGCKSFNQPFTLPDRVTSCRHMMCNCEVFNQPMTLPPNLKDATAMFAHCYELDQDIHLETAPNLVKMECMFYECKKLNRSFTVSDSIKDTGLLHAFAGCESLNSLIQLPYINDMEIFFGIFEGCTNLSITNIKMSERPR